MRGKKIKIRYVIAAVMFEILTIPAVQSVQAESCPDLRVVFARGSGGERWTDKNYLAFKEALRAKLATTSLSYEFIDLDYPAVGVGLDNLSVTAGAFFGAGDAYEFGDSVNTGVKNLAKMVNSTTCPYTRYVIGGYSQGAMVISKALGSLRSDKLIYAATFGDPKLYLPEGKGLLPAACRGENLSDYRMYVPDCQAYKGLLGAYIPYEPEALAGKVGTWCNRRDIFCSSHLSISDHTGYVGENLYEDASRVIFSKITQYFKLPNRVASPHDTAILLDSTGSMSGMIDKYKAEALRLATETLESGGRVALFDYRDLDDPYDLHKHCDFETCTLEVFQNELETILTEGGDDFDESLLSAAFHTMKALNWKQGSTKSLVILTDANFLAPDRDGITFDEVINLSKRIDPVNFYIITNEYTAEYYTEMAKQTDGKVVTNLDELSLLTDYIMARYDSLPRVEETAAPTVLPTLEVFDAESVSEEAVRVDFATTGTRTLVALNGKILGIAEGNAVVISGLKAPADNVITLTPLGDDMRGEPVELTHVFVSPPKAPNTGRL
ncbi:cutinase family protein [Candidatus Saccharibacteria bacterium]|nr:cutinase family protein [Candidatus Saccharibacteria bacterium]